MIFKDINNGDENFEIYNILCINSLIGFLSIDKSFLFYCLGMKLKINKFWFEIREDKHMQIANLISTPNLICIDTQKNAVALLVLNASL